MNSQPLPSSIIVIFGATGDLTKRKLIPALYKLFHQQKISHHHPILAIGRRKMTPREYLDHLEPENFITGADPQVLAEFFAQIQYVDLDFSTCLCRDCQNCTACKTLNRFVEALERKHDSAGNRIFYMATPPTMFAVLSRVISTCGMLDGRGFKRIAFEKPFGHDLRSAERLNHSLAEKFHEGQIFRIDHYLGKALVQDILSFRFANTIFEEVWEGKFIDNIQLTVAETLGVAGRGRYYEGAGAIRDMLQNHLMELFALVAMEMPQGHSADAIRDEKCKIIRSLSPPEPADVVIGQYTDGLMGDDKLAAYIDEPEIPKGSKTETYVAMRAFVDNARWRGVPFYLRTGKRLSAGFAEINVQFKPCNNALFPAKLALAHNLITIRIQPDTGISMTFNTKNPGSDGEIIPVAMDFCHHCLFALNTPEAYEALFQGILKGDQTIFTRWDSVAASWRFIDKVRRVAETRRLSLYPAGSLGPRACATLIKRDRRSWLNQSFNV